MITQTDRRKGAAPAPPVSDPGESAERTLRLRRDAPLSGQSGAVDALQIATPRGTVILPGLALGVREAVRCLAREETTEERLAALVTEVDGESGLLRLHLALRRLDGAGLIEHGVRVGGQPVAVLRPAGFGPFPPAPALGPQVKLSRFTVLRPGDGVLIAGSPRSHLTVELAPSATALAGALADWSDPARLAVPSLTGPGIAEVLRLFATAGLLAAGGPDDDQEDSWPAGQWSSHELWLHARSRGPRLSAGYGGTYHLRDRFAPLPAVRPAVRAGGGAAERRAVTLPQPDLDLIAAADPPLTEVIERRHSIREHDDAAPITASQLGELLYRTARLRRAFPGGDGQELADRPYPAGGSAGELEVYPLITRCDGLEPGLWHYASDRHGLELVAEPGPPVTALVDAARAASLMRADPQVVLIVAARFGRVNWKYETIAYTLTLKHVGVLYQTVYLVATAMGLAVCGLGGGSADDFAMASGCDYFAEGSVGEIVIGSALAGRR